MSSVTGYGSADTLNKESTSNRENAERAGTNESEERADCWLGDRVGGWRGNRSRYLSDTGANG